MSIDWNQKLAWALRDLPDPNLDILQLSAHRATLLGSEDLSADVGNRADWLLCSADRVPFPSGSSAARVQVDWAALPEVTHPLAKERFVAQPFDLTAAQNVVAELLAECASRFDRDARRMLLWIWRYLPERLAVAEKGPGPIASQFPADPRLPNLSLWQRFSFDTALATASPSPCFLVLNISSLEAACAESATPEDLWTVGSMAFELIWHALLPIIETYGPTAILSPCLRGNPKLDAWLAEQGISAAQDVSAPALTPSTMIGLPNVVVALVEADQAQSLGEACKQRFDDHWASVVSAIRDKLTKAKWAKQSNESWKGSWSRQTPRAWELHWTAVRWADDSTGAGNLLSWPGIYYGLWYSAALAASGARQRLGSISVLSEPSPTCSSCGHREALHDGSGDVQAFWAPLVGPKGKTSGAVHGDERLCAVCTMRRLAGQLGSTTVPEGLRALANEPSYAVMVLSLDQPFALLRGGKELKQMASLADCVHSELDKGFTKRARAHVKEVLDTPALLGPARQLAVQEALDESMAALAEIIHQAGAFALQISDREIILLAPTHRVYDLARATHALLQTSFAQVPTHGGTKLALRVGSVASHSAVITIVPGAEAPGPVLKDCLEKLQDLARAQLGGDALVITRRSVHEEERLFAAHWNDLAASMDILMASMPSVSSLQRLAQSLSHVAPALSNADLDKSSVMARASLVVTTLEELSLEENLDHEAIARAVCTLVDHCVRCPGGMEENHALDALHIAASLRGAGQ